MDTENISPNKNIPRSYTSPESVLTIATTASVLLAKELTKDQIETVINILILIVANLNAIISQQEINKGIDVVSL